MAALALAAVLHGPPMSGWHGSGWSHHERVHHLPIWTNRVPVRRCVAPAPGTRCLL